MQIFGAKNTRWCIKQASFYFAVFIDSLLICVFTSVGRCLLFCQLLFSLMTYCISLMVGEALGMDKVSVTSISAY